MACTGLRGGRGEIALGGRFRGPGVGCWMVGRWGCSPSARGIKIHDFITILSCWFFNFASCLSITANLSQINFPIIKTKHFKVTKYKKVWQIFRPKLVKIKYLSLFYEWLMHMYSALLCIVVHSKHFTIMWGVSHQPPPVCSIHLDDTTAVTGKRCQCAHHKSATGGEERES